MTGLPELAAVLLIAGGMSWAQSGAAPPPSDVGIGNSTMSQSGAEGPSMSPDQNQTMTNSTGSTTGDRNHNPGLAGSSGSQTGSAANSVGTTSTSSSTSATAGRRLPHGKKAASKQKAKKQSATQSGQQGKTVSSPVYPSGGPSTTEAPGPATGAHGTSNVPQGGNGQYSGTSSPQ